MKFKFVFIQMTYVVRLMLFQHLNFSFPKKTSNFLMIFFTAMYIFSTLLKVHPRKFNFFNMR